MPHDERETPRLRAAWTFCRLGLAGVPGLAMFPGLLLVIMGLVESSREFVGGWLIAVLVMWLVLALAGGALLRSDNVAGERPREQNRTKDLSGREMAAIVPLIVASLWLGLAPQNVLDRVDPALSRLTPDIAGRETP